MNCLGNFLVKVEAWGSTVLIWSMQAIMQYRVSCMYKHQRKAVFLMVTAFAIEVLSMAAINLVYLRRTIERAASIEKLNLCIGVHFPGRYTVYWIAVFVFELMIFILGFQAGLVYFRESRLIHSLGKHGLRKILIRDSILFPLIAFIVGGVNVFVWSRLASYSITISVTFSQLLSRILGCRLVLNLREAYYLPFESEVDPTCSQNLQFV